MGLQIWLPMNGDINNQGLANATITNTGAVVNNNGKIGKCYQFGTGTSYMNINKETVTNISGACSVCFWLNIISWNTNYSTFFQFGKSNDAWESYIMGMLRNSSGSTCCFTISNGTTASNNSYQTSALTTGIWYHVCLVYQPGKCSIYLNGELDHEYTTTIIPDFSKVTKITIGKSYNGYQTNCLMNDFRIYDNALSPREIKEISKGLVLHYPLNREGFGQDNLLSRYVSPGQQNPGATADYGRTKYYGDYGIIIPATENADTYFRLFLRKQLTSNAVYTISCYVSGLIDGTYYLFPLFAQGNSSMGVLRLDHNGFNSMTFTMTYGTQTAVTVGSETVYICFLDDAGRSISAGQGPITVTNFKIEEGSVATPFVPAPTDVLYSKMGLDDNIVYDTSGYKYNGMLAGTFVYSGDSPRYQTSTQFNGTDNGILINNLQLSNIINTAVTYSFWIKPSGENGARSVYFGSYSGTSWSIEKTAGNIIRGYWNGSPDVGYSGATITDGIWQHVCITKNGTSDIKVYINGVLKATSTATHSALTFPTTYRIGRDTRSGDGTPYKGLMSDFRIYATALSADDVMELYHTPITLSNNGTLLTQGEYVEV